MKPLKAVKFLSRFAHIFAIHDEFSGHKNRYNLFIDDCDGPLFIGRELTLGQTREVAKRAETILHAWYIVDPKICGQRKTLLRAVAALRELHIFKHNLRHVK